MLHKQVNNNMWINKEHNVSKQAESEAPKRDELTLKSSAQLGTASLQFTALIKFFLFCEK